LALNNWKWSPSDTVPVTTCLHSTSCFLGVISERSDGEISIN
jgi:hypothetical protein